MKQLNPTGSDDRSRSSRLKAISFGTSACAGVAASILVMHPAVDLVGLWSGTEDPFDVSRLFKAALVVLGVGLTAFLTTLVVGRFILRSQSRR